MGFFFGQQLHILMGKTVYAAFDLSFFRGCGGEYLDLREWKEQEGGEHHLMRSFVICFLHKIANY
jgi:hypothetical protein